MPKLSCDDTSVVISCIYSRHLEHMNATISSKITISLPCNFTFTSVEYDLSAHGRNDSITCNYRG